MKGVIRYKITIGGQDDQLFDVVQNGNITHVEFKTILGKPYTLPYLTKDVIQYLKEGKWKKVKSKREALKSPNLFSLDDL